MHNIYTYIISGRGNTAGSERYFWVDDAGTVILPVKGRINEEGSAGKAGESNIKIIRRTNKNPKLILTEPGDIHSVNTPRTISQNGGMVGVLQNQRAIRADNQQTFINAVFQFNLLVFNSVLIIFMLFHR
jgi:hypothetical protein